VIECYVRNDHLDFTIPYVDSFGNPSRLYRDLRPGEPGLRHLRRPDFIVRLRRMHRQDARATHRQDAEATSGVLAALEVKGQVRELDELKIQAGLKWAEAVNRYYGAPPHPVRGLPDASGFGRTGHSHDGPGFGRTRHSPEGPGLGSTGLSPDRPGLGSLKGRGGISPGARWVYHVCFAPGELEKELRALAGGAA